MQREQLKFSFALHRIRIQWDHRRRRIPVPYVAPETWTMLSAIWQASWAYLPVLLVQGNTFAAERKRRDSAGDWNLELVYAATQM